MSGLASSNPIIPQESAAARLWGLRKCCGCTWFNLSDPATEDAIYDSYAMRKFTGIDFMTESVPDETTLCKFRHLLEANGLNKLFFDAINRVMVQTGHMMKGGTIVDATIINAPSSTKNADNAPF